MTWVDYAVLAIIGVSVVWSIVHGLVRELLALASWVAAFFVAQIGAATVAPLLPEAIPNPSLRLLAAFLALFLTALLVMTLLSIAVSSLVRSAGLGMLDRTLGAVFGFARGLGIVMIAVLMAGLTGLPRHPAWQHAASSAPLETLAIMIKVWLPFDLSKHINYD